MAFTLEIVKEPKVTSTFGVASYWLAVQNPMVWVFQRKDLIIKAVSDPGGGETKITFFSSPYWLSPGDYVWWGDSINKNDGEYLVTAVDAANDFIKIAKIYDGHILGWVNDTTNLQNYHVYMKLFEWLGTGQQGDTIAFAKFYDDPKGRIVADVREYLQPYLDLQWPKMFGVANIHKGKNQDFSFSYRPGFVHTSIEPEFLTPTQYDTRYWAVKASKQLGDEFGQNMRKYMTQNPPTTVNEDAMTKFVTDFEEPYYFDGYPFVLGWIYSEVFTTNYIDRHMQWKDINKVNIGSEDTERLNPIDPNVVAMTLRGYLGFTNPAHANHDDVEYIEVWLEDSETTISSDNGGGGGGGSTGGGGTSYDSLESDIVVSGVVTAPTGED